MLQAPLFQACDSQRIGRILLEYRWIKVS